MNLIELLRSRRSGNGGARSDGNHLALVLEGGGMRGVASIGLAAGLESLGLTDCFDSVHGSSAGSFAAAYFAAKQSDLGGSIYYEDINNSRFIDPYRMLLGKPIMDLSYLTDEVMVRRKPLNDGSLLNRDGYLNVVLTDATRGMAKVVRRFNHGADLREALKASATIPLIAGHTANFRGQKYVDGGLVQQIPLQSALELGATHILVLMTRKVNQLFRRPSSLSRTLELLAMQIFYAGPVSAAYAVRAETINHDLNVILKNGLAPKVEIAYCSPPEGSPPLSRLTKDGTLLREAFAQSKGLAARLFDV